MRKFISYIISHLRIFYLISVMALTVVLILIMFPNDYSRVQYDHTVGSFWHGEDLYAPYDLTILKPESESEQEVQRIKDESTRYFYVDSSAERTARRRLAASGLTRRQGALAAQIVSIVYNSQGYCDTEEELDGHPVVVLTGNVGREVDPRVLTTPTDVERFVFQAVADSGEAMKLTQLLTDSILAPSIVFDANRTHLELDTRLSQVAYSSRMIQQNELIVSKGQRIDEETALALSSLEQEESHRKMADYNSLVHYVGQALLCIIAFVALYMFLKNIRHPMLDDIKKVTFAFFIVIFISAIVALLVRTNPEYVLLAPVCIVPILMRIFFDMRVALYIHIVAVIIIGNMVPNSYEFIFYQLVSGMMSIITVRNFEKRSSFFAVALVIFSTYSLIYIAGVLSTETSFATLQPQRFLIFFINAILTLLAYPLIFL
ncbi:MAG: hypothetical protein II661_05310, partial [Bacteroidales bacterium]|nr:hypothetical protein [Bacteroidales bacterium]